MPPFCLIYFVVVIAFVVSTGGKYVGGGVGGGVAGGRAFFTTAGVGLNKKCSS